MESMRLWFEEHPNIHGLAILVGFLIAAIIFELIVRRVVLSYVRNTKTNLDDEIVRRFRLPFVLSLGCVGVHYGIGVSNLRHVGVDLLDIALITFAITLWVDAIIKIIASFASQTGTDLDDEIVSRLRRPLGATVIFVGIHYIIVALSLTILVSRVLDAILVTFGVVLWTDAALKIAAAIAERTKTELDDEIVDRLRRPLASSVIFVGLRVIFGSFEFGETTMFVFEGVLITIAVVLWAQAGVGIGSAVLDFLNKSEGGNRLIQTRTMPLFDIVLKTIVYGGAAYGILLAWHINVTAWLASAGIVGIAVGFAAKDTLANLFAGIFIIADAPYKVGDFIILDSGERGRVTDIGIRSTRLLTRDDIEVTIPNAELGNAKIVNETGGPHELERVRVSIGVAYGSDIDKVREVLMEVALNSKYVSKRFEPRVRFRNFGDSSLDFQLMGWIDEPVLRGRALDELNTGVYKGLAAAGIEIPFPQRDVWIKKSSDETGSQSEE